MNLIEYHNKNKTTLDVYVMTKENEYKKISINGIIENFENIIKKIEECEKLYSNKDNSYNLDAEINKLSRGALGKELYSILDCYEDTGISKIDILTAIKSRIKLMFKENQRESLD